MIKRKDLLSLKHQDSKNMKKNGKGVILFKQLNCYLMQYIFENNIVSVIIIRSLLTQC